MSIERTHELQPKASGSQLRMWTACKRDPARKFSLTCPIRIHGHLDHDALDRVLAELVRRHEALRASFTMTPSGLRFCVGDARVVPLERIDLRAEVAAAPDALEQIVSDHVTAQQAPPFDLEHGPLFRWTLFALRDDVHHLSVYFHHLVSDGSSLGILVEELRTAYEQLAQGEPIDLPPAVGFRDFLVLQRPRAERPAAARYWAKALAGAPAHIALRHDEAPAKAADAGGWVFHTLTTPYAQLEAASIRAGGTTSMLLLTAYALLVHDRADRQRDLVIGLPLDLRLRPTFARMFGYCVNHLALRVQIPPDAKLRDVFSHVRERVVSAYAYRETALFDAVPDAHESWTVQVRFNYLPMDWQSIDPHDAHTGVRFELKVHAEPRSLFDWSLYAIHAGNAVRLNFRHRKEVLSVSSMEALAQKYDALVRRLVEDPECLVDLALDENKVTGAFVSERDVAQHQRGSR